MARAIGPKCKRCRKAKEKLFLRGDKCLSDKCVLMKRGQDPEKMTRRRRTPSPYAVQLREKQILKRVYGILETQFHNYFVKAAKTRNTAASLIIFLERRLDNVVFRLGLATSRSQARQFVRHGHITIDGRRISIPSYQVKAGQVIGVHGEGSSKMVTPLVAGREPAMMSWLNMNQQTLSGTVVRVPGPEDVKDIPCNTQLIVELYSK
jgi:small subunit ribosomal protein S4